MQQKLLVHHHHVLHLLVLCLVIITFVNSLYIHEPARLKGFIPFSIASFGLPYVTQSCDLYQVVIADPFLACSSLTNRNYRNKIVLVKRGQCTFVQKALVVQQSGAVGMIVWTPEDYNSTSISTVSHSSTSTPETQALSEQTQSQNLNLQDIEQIIQKALSEGNFQITVPSSTEQSEQQTIKLDTQSGKIFLSQQQLELQQQKQQSKNPQVLLTMSDDGNGKSVRIRSVMIKPEDGSKIMKALESGQMIRVALGQCSMLKYMYFN